jgi:hypothetical protein
MSNKFKCPCGSTDFEILAKVHDEVLYSATVYKDGTVDTNEFLNDFCGETEIADNFECRKCGRGFDISMDGPVEQGKMVEI